MMKFIFTLLFALSQVSCTMPTMSTLVEDAFVTGVRGATSVSVSADKNTLIITRKTATFSSDTFNISNEQIGQLQQSYTSSGSNQPGSIDITSTKGKTATLSYKVDRDGNESYILA